MPPSPKKPRQWLLTVASAAVLLPGCAQEHDAGEDEDDLDEEAQDRGHNKPMGAIFLPDGGTPVGWDGGWQGTVLRPDSGLQPHPPGGVMVPDSGKPPYPIGVGVRHDSGAPHPGIVIGVDAGPVGSMPVPDAGVADAGPKDAGIVKDANTPCYILTGIVAPPVGDASCTPYYPGVMPRD